MARGHSRGLSEVQGITVRSVDEQPVKANLASVFSDPKASLRDVYQAGDIVQLYDAGQAVNVRVSVVKDRSLVGRYEAGGRQMTAGRLILERDANGKVIGLKEPGRNGRRVV